jgi:hypothetical protein
MAAASYTTAATPAPTNVAIGQTVSITSSVTSSQASTVLIDVEVYDSSSTKVFQQFWDSQAFGAGQTRTYASAWQVATTATVGSYTIAIGVFSPGWGTLYTWNGAAGGVSVSTATTSTPTSTPNAVPPSTSTSTSTAVPTNTPTAVPTSTPTNISAPTSTPTHASSPSFTSSAAVSPSIVTRGGTTLIAASVKSLTAATALIDVEVYDAAGAKVFQQVWNNQAFRAGQTRAFNSTWSVPVTSMPGTFTVKIGVFSPGWSTLYMWNNLAAVTTIL